MLPPHQRILNLGLGAADKPSMGAPKPASARRPLKSRSTRLARAAAGWLADRGIGPNAISGASVVFALLAGAALVAVPSLGAGGTQIALLFVAAVCIQLRLAANLLDGLVAVEGGFGGKTGELFNEVPDRVADPLILACAGYGSGIAFGVPLGWTAATLALLTAYVRVLGGSLGLDQDFCGPMAKPQRMAVMTAACLLSALEAAVVGYSGIVIAAALALIVAGSAFTCARRLRRIAELMEAR